MKEAGAAVLRWARIKGRRFVFGPPRGRGPAATLLRRWAPLFAIVAAGTWVYTEANNVLNAPKMLCSLPMPGHWLPDKCGKWKVDGFPTKEEREDLAAVRPGDCDGLLKHENKYRGRPTAREARERLGRAIPVRETAFTPHSHPAQSAVRQSEMPFASKAAAQQDAVRRAEEDAAASACAAQDSNEHFLRATLTSKRFDCRKRADGGHVCALTYSALCHKERRREVLSCN